MSNHALEDKKMKFQVSLPQYKGPHNHEEHNKSINNFAEFTHNYIHDNIWRADQKSTIIFTFILFTFLFLFNPTNMWYGKKLIDLFQCGFHRGQLLIYAMIFSFAISIFLAFLTILPRLKMRSYSSNLLYWESILKDYKELKKYTTKVRSLTPDEIVEIKLEHCYEISSVCKKKLKTSKYSMVAAIIGIILFLVVQFSIAFYPEESFGLQKQQGYSEQQCKISSESKR